MGDRIDDEDSPFHGMTHSRARGMVGRIMEGNCPHELFPLKRKQGIAEYTEGQAMDESLSLFERLVCVDKVIKMQQVNLEYQKLHVQTELAVMKGIGESNEAKNEGPQVILVLPSNGSEVSSEA